MFVPTNEKKKPIWPMILFRMKALNCLEEVTVINYPLNSSVNDC